MADLTGVHYRPGASVVHRLDARMKLALMAAISIACLHLGFAGLLVLISAPLAAAAASRALPAVRAGELRWLGFLLGLVWFSRVISTDGAPVFSLWGITITQEGLTEGTRMCLRLVLIFWTGSLFVVTTRSAAIKAAVQWYLRPFPFIPVERVGTMLALLVRFVPMILEEISRLSEAQRSRGVENRRNPVYRMVKFGIPLLTRIFQTSDRLVIAMEARCYSTSRTPPEFSASSRDWTVFAAGLTLVLLALIL